MMSSMINTLKKISSRFRSGTRFGVVVTALLLSMTAQASFKLETPGVVFPENEKRVSLNIENTSNNPILLVSKLTDLDGKDYSKRILISPPISRIDPGQSQQINFVLKAGPKLEHEVLMKATFEGVAQAKENVMQMPISQTVGFLLQPSSVSVSDTPWDGLVAKQENGQLVISNTSKRVVRLLPQITLLPSKKIVSLKQFYILPGESETVKYQGAAPSSYTIYPLSRYGFKVPDVTLPIAP